MCVILLIDQKRPSDDMVEKAWHQNDDGGGVAWRETFRGKPVVKWKKGIESVEEMKALAKTLPMPFIMHFRIASVGGVRPELTHPFPISKNTSLDLKGTTDGWVLFHNGDWRGWAETGRHAAIASNTQIPPGKWSDTRAMAWLCAIYGIGFMEYLDTQKGIAFGPGEDDLEVFAGNGWAKVDGIWCSNDYFHTRAKSHGSFHGGTSQPLPANTYHYCKYRTCTTFSNLDKDGYCSVHAKRPAEAGGTQQAPPFPQNLITVREAELLSKKDREGNRKLSKGQARRVRKLWSILAGKNKHKMEDAKEELLQISLKTILSRGSVH